MNTPPLTTRKQVLNVFANEHRWGDVLEWSEGVWTSIYESHCPVCGAEAEDTEDL